MLLIENLPAEIIDTTLSLKDFPSEFLHNHDLVILILTQDWCPQWESMENWLTELKENDFNNRDTAIYICLYNLIPQYNQFMKFKEDILGNVFIPYVRYYSAGTLKKESNFVPKEVFLRNSLS